MTPQKETQQQFLNVFGLILLSTLFISIFSNVGVYIEDQLFAGGKFGAGAVIGTVPVGQLSRTEAKEKLDQSIGQWQKQAKVILDYQGQEIPLKASIFEFDEEKSVSQATADGSSPLLVSVKEQVLQDEMKSALSVVPASLNWSLLEKDVVAKVSSLSRSIRVHIDGFVKLSSEEKIVAEADLSLPFDMPVLQEWTKKLNEVEIKAGDQFSLLSTMSAKGLTPLESNDLQFLASTIYSASLQTNMAILERHISQTKPAFIPLGFEAEVIPSKWDLVLQNPGETSYTLNFICQSNKMRVLIKGVPFRDTYSVLLADQKEYSPRTIIQWNTNLSPGEQVEKKVGQPGQSIKVYRVIKEPKGKTQKVLMAEDFYFPQFRIVEASPTPAPSESDSSTTEMPSTPTRADSPEPIQNPVVNDHPVNSTPSKQPSVPVHVIGRPI